MKTEICNDPNFLCGLIIPENNFELYFTYIGTDHVKYDSFWNDKPLFSGSDYRPSPLYCIDSLNSVISILGFLTLRKGDTDDEYFKDYTTLQFEWSDSADCEQIRYLLSDYESGEDDEFYEPAKSFFTEKYIPQLDSVS